MIKTIYTLAAALLCCAQMGAQSIEDKGSTSWWRQQMSSSESTKTPKARRDVIVAVIDGGVDIMHPYLKDFVWRNKAERPDGIDNDGNGFVDDLHGWNFLGNAEGENIFRTGTADYREYKRLHLRSKNEQLTESEEIRMDSLSRKLHLDSYVFYAHNLNAIAEHITIVDSLMARCYGNKATTLADFHNLQIDDSTDVMNAVYTVQLASLPYEKDTPWYAFVQEKVGEGHLAMDRIAQLDVDDDAHAKVGNNRADFAHLNYGNAFLFASSDDAFHGTMVAGLVAQAARELSCSRLRIIPIRAIPDGDEYDRDVIAALRYAIDNGAKVVNMSFGKTLSPNHAVVDSMLDIAAKHDVLLVKASGNSGKDNDKETFYPSPLKADGSHRENMLVVGASDSLGQMPGFSNYGLRTVDILAPGDAILSTAPCNEWSLQRGTSLSAPIVTGVAAVIRSCYPRLSAADVRRIIMASSVRHPESRVAAGVLDARRALEMAGELSRGTLRFTNAKSEL